MNQALYAHMNNKRKKKEMVSKLKRTPTEWEIYLPATHQTKD
jgi:hypothetical protein